MIQLQSNKRPASPGQVKSAIYCDYLWNHHRQCHHHRHHRHYHRHHHHRRHHHHHHHLAKW